MSDLFLSHACADHGRYDHVLASASGVSGVAVWHDGIAPAQPIPRAMSDAIDRSDLMLCIWSAAAAAADHVWNEICAFYMRNPAAGRLLFVRIDSTPIPTLFAARAWLDCHQANFGDALVEWIESSGQASPEVAEHHPDVGFLALIAPGPMVEQSLVSDAIPQAFAERHGRSDEAIALVNEAARVLRDASTGPRPPSTVAITHLPSPDIGAQQFWRAAFFEACKHGPRMLASLLLVGDDAVFPEGARRERAKVLDRLHRGNYRQ